MCLYIYIYNVYNIYISIYVYIYIYILYHTYLINSNSFESINSDQCDQFVSHLPAFDHDVSASDVSDIDSTWFELIRIALGFQQR